MTSDDQEIVETWKVSVRLKTFALVIVFLVVLSSVSYFYKNTTHPPGFYIDESSIAYNAHLISKTGRDEYGNLLPLYFKAFGDYKNPTYVYLLVAVFRIVGPSITAARLLSATLGALAALCLAFLGWKISRCVYLGLIVALSALLTPWLFEASRLVFEVAAYPLLLVLFLLAVWRAASSDKWTWRIIVALAVTLALLTYSYSIGRLLAPLLATGLILLVTKQRRAGLIKVWALYLLLFFPLLIFHWRNPGALTGRFSLLTYVRPGSGTVETVASFFRQYAINIDPWRWLMTGENNIRDHVEGTGSLLVGTVILGIFGLVLVLKNERSNRWWRFVLYGLVVSVIPASLTVNDFPQLRLIAFPVFFHLLLIPSLDWLSQSFTTQRRRQILLFVSIGLIVIQGFWFQLRFHSTSSDRWYVFDARFPHKILATALATNQRPIYVVDPPGNSGYIQTYWHATLQGLDTSQFIRVADTSVVPPGSVVISSAENCSDCQLLTKAINFIVYTVPPLKIQTITVALPAEAFRANVWSPSVPATMKAGQNVTLDLIIKNTSSFTWPAVGDSEGQGAMMLTYRWSQSENDATANGAGHFPYDLEPGDTAGILLPVKAPANPGEYSLEIGLMQKPFTGFVSIVSWRVRVL